MASRSPFPGMDPWLEGHWRDVHARYITSTANQLNAALPPGLVAAVEETTKIVDSHRDGAWLFPDVSVVEQRPASESPLDSGRGGAAVEVAKPVILRSAPVRVPVRRIEIRGARGGAVITVVELISPANKLNRHHRADYLAKRAEYHDAGVNVVEIDLVRSGQSIVDLSGADAEADPALAVPYKCVVWRAADPTAVEFYALHLRARLPRIRIPLRATDADVIIDLQQPIDLAYAEGRFADRIDYSVPPAPPLLMDDAAWAAERVRERRSTDEALR